MTLPAPVLVRRERRGRPRREVDVEIVDILVEHGISRRRIARALRIPRQTINRRVAERRRSNAPPLLLRCDQCGALAISGRCPNNHEINPGFLGHP